MPVTPCLFSSRNQSLIMLDKQLHTCLCNFRNQSLIMPNKLHTCLCNSRNQSLIMSGQTTPHMTSKQVTHMTSKQVTTQNPHTHHFKKLQHRIITHDISARSHIISSVYTILKFNFFHSQQRTPHTT